MALTFRRAVPAEREDAQRILWTAFTPYIRNLGREITERTYAFLPAAIERGDVYVALDGEEVVGAATTELRPDGLYLDRLGVAPTRQRTGLGSWMLVRIEEVARSLGARAVTLETAEMAEGNIRLYRRHGFEIVRRGLPGHGMDAHMRVFMEKTL
jgi:ribosomal protein S18 acetylase RimI-like enzyme